MAYCAGAGVSFDIVSVVVPTPNRSVCVLARFINNFKMSQIMMMHFAFNFKEF